jgi:hypothetical protein
VVIIKLYKLYKLYVCIPSGCTVQYSQSSSMHLLGGMP